MQRAAFFALVSLCEPALGRRLGEPAAANAEGAAIVDSLSLSSECTEACPGKKTLEGCFGVQKRKCQAELAAKFELSNTNTAEDNEQILQSFQASSAGMSPEAAALAEATPAATHVPSVGELLRSNTAPEVSSSSSSASASSAEEPAAASAALSEGDRADEDDEPFEHPVEIGTLPNGMIGETSKLASAPDVVAAQNMPPEVDMSYGDHIRSVVDNAHKATHKVEAEVAVANAANSTLAFPPVALVSEPASATGSASGPDSGIEKELGSPGSGETVYSNPLVAAVDAAKQNIDSIGNPTRPAVDDAGDETDKELKMLSAAYDDDSTKTMAEPDPASSDLVSSGPVGSKSVSTESTSSDPANSASSASSGRSSGSLSGSSGSSGSSASSASSVSPGSGPAHNPFASSPPLSSELSDLAPSSPAASAKRFRFRARQSRMAAYADHAIYPEHAFQPLLLNPQPQFVDYSNIGLAPNTMPAEGLGYSRYRPTMPSASGVYGNQYGPGDIDGGNPYNSMYGYSDPPTYGAQPEGAYTEKSDQASRFGGLFNPDVLISGKPKPPPKTGKPKDMGQYPLTSPQGVPYSYMPPSGAFLMNNGYGGGYNTGGIPGGDPMSATSSENDAMPGTGAGKTTSLLERLSRRIRRRAAPAVAPPRVWPLRLATYQPNQGLPKVVNQESVDDLTGQQFLGMLSSLDTANDAASPLPFPTMQAPQEMPSIMNPANPAYAGRR